MKSALLLLVACGSPAPAPVHEKATPDPPVDMACVERARDGKLLDGLPTTAGGFTVTGGTHLHRDGRELTDADAAKLWEQMNRDVFVGAGLSSGDSGLYSVYTCSDAPKNNCFKMHVFLCQLDLPALAARISAAAEHAGVSDAMISVDLTYVESRGPSCRSGAACKPVAHYSVKNAVYDPSKPRHAQLSRGWGACRDDGDCEGADSNNCVAWYAKGGAESDVYIMHRDPTFCGCVEHECRWFTQ